MIAKFTLTSSEFYPYFEGGKLISFSADFVINDKFLIQRGSNEKFSIPDGDTACWESDDEQDFACGNYSASEIASQLDLESECVHYHSCMLTA